MLLGTIKFPTDSKTLCKSLRRLHLSFHFYLQKETDEVMNQGLQGLPPLSNTEWLCDLIFLADVFISSLAKKLQSPRKFTSPRLGYANSSGGTLIQTAKVPFRHEQKRCKTLPLCLCRRDVDQVT